MRNKIINNYFVLILLALFIFIFFNKNSSIPSIDEAVFFCSDVANDIWIDEERTFQDKCIDDFMSGNIGSSIFELFNMIEWRNT